MLNDPHDFCTCSLAILADQLAPCALSGEIREYPPIFRHASSHPFARTSYFFPILVDYISAILRIIYFVFCG